MTTPAAATDAAADLAASADAATIVARLRRRERWLLALAAVRTELLSGGTVDQAMTLIAEQCSELVGADGTLFLLADDRGRLTVWAAVGEIADLGSDLGGGAGRGPVVDSADPWVDAIRDALGPHDTAEFPTPLQPQLAACWAKTGPVLAAPIPARVGAGGIALCLRRDGREQFDADSGPELVGLVEQASIALEVADRAEQRRALELLSDRQRIARDLHDHVIQRLFAVGLSLQGQVGRIGEGAVREKVDYAVSQIDEAIADLRSVIYDLRSADDTTGKSLRRRLADIAAATGGNDGSGPRVSVRVAGPIDTVVSAQLADDAEAVVREGINNALKYAGASAIHVLVRAGAALEITVTDDGCGIGVDAARSGLKNLTQRALSHGGSFAARSVTEEGRTGTELAWVAPLR